MIISVKNSYFGKKQSFRLKMIIQVKNSRFG